MKCTKTDSGTEIRMSFDGPAQIDDAEALVDEMKRVFETDRLVVTLSLGGLTQVDVSFFQVLLVMSASLAAKGRHLMIQSLPADHVVMETAALLGISLDRHIAMGGTRT